MNSRYTLSLKSGRRLCKINGGKMHNKIIYLYDKNFKCCDKHKKNCSFNCCSNCCFNYYHLDNEEQENNINYCNAGDGKFIQVPTNETFNTDCNYYTGKRGCGKSSLIGQYSKQYKLFEKKNKIFLFSEKTEDPTLDQYITKRINLNTFINDGGLKLDDFKEPCLCIFDDLDCLKNNKENGNLKEKIYNLRDSIIQIGRSKGLTVCQSSHIATNHEETKHILNGCTTFSFFPHSINEQIKNALKLYLGLTNEQIKKVLALKDADFITIFHISPSVVMTDKKIFILD